MAKFATGIRPPRVVDTLPVTPFVGYENGDTVVLTTDSKLYRFNGTGFTKAVDGLDIISNSNGRVQLKQEQWKWQSLLIIIRPPGDTFVLLPEYVKATLFWQPILNYIAVEPLKEWFGRYRC